MLAFHKKPVTQKELLNLFASVQHSFTMQLPVKIYKTKFYIMMESSHEITTRKNK